MKAAIFLGTGLVAAIASFGIPGLEQDDPDYPATYGKWELQFKVTEVNVEGDSFDEIPSHLTKDFSKKKTICGEPTVREIGSYQGGKCEITDRLVKGTYFSAKGQCKGKVGRMRVTRMGLSIKGRVEEDKLSSSIIQGYDAEDPSYGSFSGVNYVSVKGKRVGDC